MEAASHTSVLEDILMQIPFKIFISPENCLAFSQDQRETQKMEVVLLF